MLNRVKLGARQGALSAEQVLIEQPIFAQVRTIISSYVGHDSSLTITEDADLSDLGVDPLDRLSITCDLDEAFLIEIPDADEESWITVADVVKTVVDLCHTG